MERRVGVCFIGALGSISVTTIVGALAIRKSLEDSTGMATAAEPFDQLDLISVDDLQFFGFDIRKEKLGIAAEALTEHPCGLNPRLLASLTADLKDIEPNIFPGFVMNCGDAITQLCSLPEDNNLSLREITDQLQQKINGFKRIRRLDDVIVINLASTEPP